MKYTKIEINCSESEVSYKLYKTDGATLERKFEISEKTREDVKAVHGIDAVDEVLRIALAELENDL